MRLFTLCLFAVGCDATVATTTDTGVVDEWGTDETDTDTQSTDTDTAGDTDTSGDTDTAGDTDTGPTLSACQTLLQDAGYPVRLDDGTADTLVVTLNGALYTHATVSWGVADTEEDTDTEGSWMISCGEIVGQSSATMPVDPTSPYGASTFTTDSTQCESPDLNTGWCWFHQSVTGASLGGVTYHVTGEADNNAVLTQDTPPE